MSSKVDTPLDGGTSPKLPALHEGHSSLVSPDQRPQTLTPRESAVRWAADTRSRINNCIETQEEVTEEDIRSLKQELIPILVVCLQQDTRPGWKFLVEVLSLLEPYREYFKLYDIKAEVNHYIERLIHHAKMHKERLFDLHIVESLAKAFPIEVDTIRESGTLPRRNYCVTVPSPRMLGSPNSSPSLRKMVPQPPSLLHLPDGTNPYSQFIPTEEQLLRKKVLTIGDLRKSIANVAVEMACRESIWTNAYGTVAKALQTDIPELEHEIIEVEKEEPGYKLTPRTSIEFFKAAERRGKKTPRIADEPVPVMTGREAVEHFVKCSHLGNVKSLFFNLQVCRHYQPYNLICVHKNKINSEHFVFSTFGVLHVQPNTGSESMSLAEWQREAVLWSAMSSIPFFKTFLIRKMFQRWRANKLYLDYLRRQKEVSAVMLQNVPAFGAALLQVLRLLKELITVNFLPLEIEKTYHLSEFENNVNYKNIQAEKILERFFKYCKMVVDVTAEESFNKLRYCEEQVRKKAYFSKDSLHMQKVKKEQREENLRKARSETGRLGNFVKLVDQMIVEHMFHITKTQVISFVKNVLKVGEDSLRDGFFKADLVFTKHDVLGISPSKEKLTKVLNNTLNGIPTVLCANAVSMDGSIQEPDPSGLPDEYESTIGPKSEHTKSVADTTRSFPERRKSTAATTLSSVKQESHTQASEGQTVTSLAGDGTVTETTHDSGKSKSMSGDDSSTGLPDILRQPTQTKSEDELGVATPDLVVRDEDHALIVEGEGFMGQYDPLTRANLEEKLDMDEDFQVTLNAKGQLLNDALEEIDQYCDYNKWLNEIHQFCKKWTEKSVKEFKGVAAFTIEQRLTELRQWSEKVRSFDRNFVTENGMFYIDCSHIHEILLPRLNDIYLELVMFVAEEAKNLADNFCVEMKTILQNMKNKTKTVDAFAAFAKNFTQYKKNTTHYQQRVEYIKSLYEVIRMSYRQLTPDEEKYEENVWTAWEAFLLQMQDASEFVNTQTPLMTQLLEDSYQELERQAYELEEIATTGKFLDPNEDATRILMDLKKVREKFFDIQRQLQEASRWRDAICGEPYDLVFLNEMTVKLDVRQELWKYVEVSYHCIKDWKSMLFKKMNIKKSLEKVIEWQAAASQLKPYLPAQDAVLTTWYKNLQEFKKYLPILHKLANDALKERHWKAIFVGMNEPYDPKKQFTVSELLTYDLEENAQLIHSIYLGAVSEYDLELKIGQMRKFWEEREFKLAKHIPDSVLMSKDEEHDAGGDDTSDSIEERKLKQLEAEVLRKKKKREPKKNNSPRRRTKLEKYRQERAAAANVGTPRGLNVADDDFFILIEVDELKYQLEDSRISIQSMMQSPYLGDMKEEVESWSSNLQQVEEVTNLWFVCQKKWLYLLKVFEKPELFKRFSKHAPKFENVHTKFKDWMRVVSNDSKVLTVVNRRRGEKGYRLLQGDNLRSLFLQLIQMQEETVKNLSSLMESCRLEYTRLYFLSDEELVDMLGVSRNPQALMPFAKKCFPGITSLAFALPPGTSSLNSHLDFALHADKLQVIAMRGFLSEEVPFFAHLEAQNKSSRWLKLLESIMKNTMSAILQACVQVHMEEGTRQPILLLDEVRKLRQPKTSDTAVEDTSVEIQHKFRHWLLRFPVQCVSVAEGVLWERSLSRVLEKQDMEKDDIKYLRMNTSSRMDQYVDLLKESYHGVLPAETKQRLFVLLSILVIQSIKQRDSLDAMLREEVVNDRCFEWLKMLRYHMDIRNVLRAKQEPIDHPASQTSQSSSQLAQGRKTTRTSNRKAKARMEAIEEPKAPMTRTKTSVSTDYQFSSCTIQQLGNTFLYDYEYLGPVNRLVLTPLTERAFLSLTQALKNFHCGTLMGPSGTGKSETIKDLAKMFGRNLFSVNCNQDITIHMMLQYMMGMVQSGCWLLFDDTDRLTKGLMSVTAQHLDYLRSALRTLDTSNENQYKIRGQPRSDKKTGTGDAVIRRNSLTTLHPLPPASVSPQLERQKTVPHGFNEKGLVTYFEETWIAEKDQRRHSIEREIEIKESELYNKNKPPPLFFVNNSNRRKDKEHARFKGKKASPDYGKLLQEASYKPEFLGSIMFHGKLLQASANFGCFMTVNTNNPQSAIIPETYRLLLRPCALVVPDIQIIMETSLLCSGYQHYKLWAKKLALFLRHMTIQLPRMKQICFGIKEMKGILNLALSVHKELQEAQEMERSELEDAMKQTGTKIDTPPLIAMDPKALEEQSLVQALIDSLQPSLETEDQIADFLSILRDIFPLSTNSKAGSGQYLDTKLVNSVRDQLNEDNIKDTPQIMDKILELYATIQQKEAVILCGRAGSGKSTCLQILCRALNRLNYLLFAPDHSKDELSTDRDFLYYSKQKLQESNMDEFIAAEEEFLNKIGAPKVETTKGGKKFRRMTSMLTKVNEAIHELELKKTLEYALHPKIDTVRLNPTAMTSQELLGSFNDGLWQGGLLPKIMKDSSFMSDAVRTYLASYKEKQKGKGDLPSVLLRWVILDGVLHPSWSDSLNTILNSERKLSLANGGRVPLHVESTQLMFETADMTEVSPAIVSQCKMIHFSDETVAWSSLLECWAKTAKSKWIFTSACMKIIQDLFVDVFGPSLKFLNTECSTALLTDISRTEANKNHVVTGVQEVCAFISMFSAFLDRGFSRDEFEKKIHSREPDETMKLIIISRNLPHLTADMGKVTTPSSTGPSRAANSRMTSSSQIEHNIPNYMEHMKSMFAVSYIWSFGGHIHDRHKEKFSSFAHDVLYRASHPIRMPLGGSVYDYTVDDSTGGFISWRQKTPDRTKTLAGGFVVTPEVEKYSFMVDLLLGSHQPVLLAGAPGVGKTALVQNMVTPKHTSTNIIMSPGMTSAIFQEALLAHILELKSKAFNVMSAPGAPSAPSSKIVQKHLFFIDDLNTAARTDGYQPPLELLTQILCQSGVYDRQRQEFQDMSEALILGCATLPSVPGVGMGEACHMMSSRLTRLFFNLTLFSPNPEGILSTFGRSIQHWLEEFPTYSVEHHFEFARAMTLGLLELYQKVKEKFRPTPCHAHYVFSIHDISRVVQGILLMSPRSRSRKMLRIKNKKGNNPVSRQTSTDSRGRASRGSNQTGGGGGGGGGGGMGPPGAGPGDGASPPMMKVIAQLWCHECTRTFADRLVTDEDQQQFGRVLEEIVVKQFCSPRDDPKSEMAAISEETVSQTGRSSPRASPPPLQAYPSESEGEDNPDEGEDESPTSQSSQAQSQASKSRSTSQGSRASQLSTASHLKDQSITPNNSTIAQSMPLDLSQADQGDITDVETRHSSRQGAGTGRDTVGASETEEETESEDSSEGETTETETETLIGTPRDFDGKGGEMRSSLDDSSRGTSRTSGVEYYCFCDDFPDSSKSTSSSEQELTDRSVRTVDNRQGKHTTFADQSDVLQKGKGTPRTKRQQARGSNAGAMRHVHFKPGLMADRDHIAFFGPLMKLEEIKGPGDNLTDFLFSKFFMTTHTETLSLSVEKGYVDTNEELLAEALQTCLSVYNAGTSQRLELVFFKQAILHAARLSRVLALQGGHALLLATSYCTGRATLVRLASYIAHCKCGKARRSHVALYEPKAQTDTSKNHRIVREQIKRACYHTGILSKPTVLLVHEDLGTECLQDVAAVMAEGTSPGLYTEDELQSIVSQMMPGGVQTKRIDKIEQAFERFLKRIRQNLHVVVLLSYRGNSYSSDFKGLHQLMCKYPGLLKHSSSVDHYQPWSYDAHVKIAEVWLTDEKVKVHVPWHPNRRLEQIDLTSRAMAYIHMSAKAKVERQFCHQRAPLRIFSPLTFMEFVHIFRIIAAFIVKKETSNIYKHEQALGKVNEAFGSINEFKREVSDLSPQHKDAVSEIKDLVEEVEVLKVLYIESLDRCKEQETAIEALQGPLERLRKDAQSEFDKLNPNYRAAMQALSALNRNDIEEVKSFREPPALVKHVVNALCLLFNKPQDWEYGKLLLTREHFIQDLIFYNKDNVPEEIFEQLCELVKDPMFQPDLVGTVSKAAMGICMWVHSVQKYSDIHRNMQPRLKNLLEQEEKFTRAQAKLGQLRVDANRIKSGLERKIQVHKAAVKRAKTIFKQMQNIERKISRAVNLMENMSMQHFLWKSELKKAKHQIFTAPGDALVTTACVCYHGPLNDKHRAELMHDWVDRCRQGNFTLPKSVGSEVYPMASNFDNLFDNSKEKDSMSETSSMQTEQTASETGPALPEIRTYKYQPVVYDTSKYYSSELKRHGSMEYEPAQAELDDSDDEEEQSTLMNRNGFLLQDILSDFDELSKWRLEGRPTDLHTVQNALLMRVSCYNRKHCWPLLIDPDNQAETWVKTIQTSRNIFTEKDVRDDDVSEIEDLPQLPESSQDKDTPETSLPPSRGTALTFSDVTTEYHTDGETTNRDTATSSRAFTATEYTKSMGRHSRNSWNTDEMRPVTSVTASWEMYSLHPDQSITHPVNNLWIIEADNPNLDSRLINAIVHGVTVLVTHLERKPIDPLYRGLLLKQFYVDKDNHKVVRVGNQEFRYHPNFCLYLSTSVPLFIQGDGLHSIPIHRMCIINMALSDEAIINHMLQETMRVERKEFEGQRRSNENDIILHRQRLAREHELIREKTLNLFGPLLDDQTMLDSLINCQKEVERNRMILEETRYMGDHLEEKFAHYIPMIMQSAMLYNMVKRMGVLHPCYYMPFYKFMEMYSKVIKSRDRGKGTQVEEDRWMSAPQARAKELSDAIYGNMFRYLSLMMFEQHFLLLQLLVSMERMRISRKASSKELGLFLNGFDKQGLDEAALLEFKPVWMKPETWIDSIVLEQLHHSFHGLRKSLITNSEQWCEYFSHPVALMNQVPGSTLQDLSIIQKCVLWKFCCPDKLSEVAHALILYELGSIRTIPDHYNIREVYNFVTKTTPVVFILPKDEDQDPDAADATKGLPYVSPAHEVKRLAKEVGMEGKVRVMNFGVTGQVIEARHALEDCIQNGSWLLLQNYHLAEEPEPEFFNLLKNLVYSKWTNATNERQDSILADESGSLVTHSKPSTEASRQKQLNIANTFRLWITTQSDAGRPVPGVLIQHGMTVTAESTGNFKSTLQKSYRSVAFLLNNFKVSHNETGMDKTARVMSLALLHSLLLQQCYYGNSVFRMKHHWSLTDLAMAVDLYKKVMLKCDDKAGVQQLVTQVYTDHCIDSTDSKVVHSLVSTLVKFAAQPASAIQEAPDKSIVKLLKTLMYMDENQFNLKRATDMMEELSARVFGLPENADQSLTTNSSNILAKDMVQVVGAPELFIRVTSGTSSTVISQDSLIPQYLAILQNLPTMPDTDKNQVYPIDTFMHFEVQGYKHLVDTISTDLGLLQRKVKGEILPDSYMKEVIYAFNKDVVPPSWLSQTFPSCISLSQWMEELPMRMQILKSYIMEEKPATYNLSVFLRPDRFLESIQQTFARKQFKEVDNIELHVEVMPAILKPSLPPTEGIFISNLRIHNALWDLTRGILMQPTPDSRTHQDMPIFCLKPVDITSDENGVRANHLYSCPVYCSEDVIQHGSNNVVVHFSLPSPCEANMWQHQRVYLSSCLPQP